MNETVGIISGFENGFGKGAIICVVSVVMVFLILGLIIVICEAIGSAIEKSGAKKPAAEPVLKPAYAAPVNTLDLNDEDAVVASLIASIECRNEFHKNVKVVSVRKVG